jgi:DNA-directed RNA polymerase specialized sigma24 family protein
VPFTPAIDVPWGVPEERRPRLRPISPGTISDNVRANEGVSDAELVARLYDALATLPAPERAAAVVAIGLGEGPAGAAMELEVDVADADAITRNALQLLRGALGDIDLGDPATYGQLPRRAGHRPAAD